MGCPAYSDDNHLHHALLHSRGQGGGVDTIAGELAKTYGLQRQRHLTMGAGYQSEIDYTAIAALSHIPCVHLTAERHALSNLNDNDANFNFQMDLIAAAGAMTAEMKDVIAEITAMGEDLSVDQKEAYIRAVFNTYQLQQANEGRLTLTPQQAEHLALETIEIMDGLAKDVALSPAFKEISTGIIKTTADIHNLDTVTARLTRFEQDTAPAKILEQSIEALATTLQALLDTDDLDEDSRQKIEDILERLEAVEGGEMLPRDIIKDLNALSETITNGEFPATIQALADALRDDVRNVSEANIMVKAEKFDLTIAQIRAIEATMDRLEQIAENLPVNQTDLKEQITMTIQALDQEPVALKTKEMLVDLNAQFQKPEISILTKTGLALAEILNIFKTETLFTQKIITDQVDRRIEAEKESPSLPANPPVFLKPEFEIRTTYTPPEVQTPRPVTPPEIAKAQEIITTVENKATTGFLDLVTIDQYINSPDGQNLQQTPEGQDTLKEIEAKRQEIIEEISRKTGLSPEEIENQLQVLREHDDATPVSPDPVNPNKPDDNGAPDQDDNNDNDNNVDQDQDNADDPNIKPSPDSEKDNTGHTPEDDTPEVTHKKRTEKESDPTENPPLKTAPNETPRYEAPPVIKLNTDGKLDSDIERDFGPKNPPKNPTDTNDSPCKVCPIKGKCKKAANDAAKGKGGDKTPPETKIEGSDIKVKRSLGKSPRPPKVA